MTRAWLTTAAAASAGLIYLGHRLRREDDCAEQC